MISLIFVKLESNKQEKHISPIYNHEEPKVQPKPEIDSMINIKADLGQWIDQKISKLEKRVDTIDHKTWLLAVINNENAVISKKIAGDSEFADKYIIFDKTWKLSKMPEFLSISKEDYQKLIKSANSKPLPKTNNRCY